MAETFSRTVEGHQINQAIEKWRERLQQDPNSAEAHYAIGLTYLNAKLREQAIEHLRKAANIAPEVADIHYTLSLALFNDGDLNWDSNECQEAIKRMAMASQLSPNFREAAAFKHFFTGRQINDANPEGAISEYIKATEVSPDLAIVWNNMGLCYQQIGRHEDAYTCLGGAVNLNPINIRLCTNYSATCAEVEKFDEGIQYGKHAVSLYDPGIHPQVRAGNAYFHLYSNFFGKGKENGWNRVIMEEAHESIKNAYALHPDEVNRTVLEAMNELQSNGYKPKSALAEAMRQWIKIFLYGLAILCVLYKLIYQLFLA